ncbi:MAG TPA: DUF4126 family protein [Rubrobacteraceae bacterium]|nr:DUF4126 family protein [Rubrobacteraceae bacterium]
MPSLFERRSRVEFEVSPATFETLRLATIAGLRSMAAPALLARALRRGDLDASNLPALGSPRVSTLLSLLAVGEMIADKTPLVPTRTSAPALLGRVLSGALVGVAVFASKRRDKNAGAILGALYAVGTSYAGEAFRTSGSEQPRLPNAALGVLEDRVVLALRNRLLRRT